MPVADHARYCEMLDRARRGRYAYPAINVTSLTTANAVLEGLARSRCDGIIQVSTGGAAFASGAAVKDMVVGAVSIAEHVQRVAERYPVYVALHTDHCPADKLDAFVVPLRADVHNVTVETADAFARSDDARYDAVVLTGSLPVYDARFEQWLAPGGRLFVVTGEGPVMEARRITATAPGQWRRESLFETVMDPLIHATQPPRFVF